MQMVATQSQLSVDGESAPSRRKRTSLPFIPKYILFVRLAVSSISAHRCYKISQVTQNSLDLSTTSERFSCVQNHPSSRTTPRHISRDSESHFRSPPSDSQRISRNPVLARFPTTASSQNCFSAARCRGSWTNLWPACRMMIAKTYGSTTAMKTYLRSCRLAVREPLEAAEAYLNIRPHKERPGVVYTHLRPNWEVLDNAADIPDDEELDWLDVKVGEAGDLDVRREYYERDCVDEPILWAYYYQTSNPKLIERLTHLTLRAMGAQRVPYPCYGCAVRHREHSSEAKGGLEVVAGIIEYWMRRIGEDPIRVPIHA
ncbi:hypothetical protein B0H13DRAFT_1897690 [Mycena leptocephala]|nr:hypothetical protein B0H13DRAFT_1897690 [Mycena leptocephala]